MDHKPLILIVDDEDDFPEIISAKLAAANMDTIHVKNPKLAVEEAVKRKPDLILMDINMPEEQGPDLLLDFKMNETTKDIKVVFLTNSKDPWPGISGSQHDVAVELGAEDFLQKTDDLGVLFEKIKTILGIPSGPATKTAPTTTANAQKTQLH